MTLAVAYAGVQVEKAEAEGSVHDVIHWSLVLGRLAEWWTWVELGLDKKAVSKINQEGALPKASKARREKASKEPPLWHEEAREIAKEKRLKNPKMTNAAIARQLFNAGDLRKKDGEAPSERSIRRAISRSS